MKVSHAHVQDTHYSQYALLCWGLQFDKLGNFQKISKIKNLPICPLTVTLYNNVKCAFKSILPTIFRDVLLTLFEGRFAKFSAHQSFPVKRYHNLFSGFAYDNVMWWKVCLSRCWDRLLYCVLRLLVVKKNPVGNAHTQSLYLWCAQDRLICDVALPLPVVVVIRWSGSVYTIQGRHVCTSLLI